MVAGLDFEKLGAFYLGKRYDTQTDSLTDELTLYDSKDLTTHGVIIGMTGSGKTGLGIAMLEEAAIDKVPVIAIDPKGDMGNLLLNFPQMSGANFQPWVDASAATQSGKTVEEHAADTAAMWKKGIGDWGQNSARVKKLRDAVDMRLYTPGSSTGTPISVLRTLKIEPELLDDKDAFRDRVSSTVQSILTLLDIDADPLTSREHILMSRILHERWHRGDKLTLPDLIGSVQSPPFDRVGVMELDAFYPAQERFELAMRINNLLAAPGFEVWTQGDPLDINTLLYSPEGKPRVSVLSIAHLNDAERMFFVTSLLNELVSWMRTQSGSPSLRAILYMDEIFGYLPPVANPPSKPLFLTLLKQARAFGLGLVLATQNPIDLDYKALSNIGTWMIGRLQTKRDIDRLRNGLEAASGTGNLDLEMLDEIIAGMPKRCFLLNNVHEKNPVIFHTRWVMSYLAGPLTTAQIRQLTPPPAKSANQPVARQTKKSKAGRHAQAPDTPSVERPLLNPKITEVFVPAAAFAGQPGETVYLPRLLVSARIRYSRARPPIELEQRRLLLIPADGSGRSPDWDAAVSLEETADQLETEAQSHTAFADLPDCLGDPKTFTGSATRIRRWLRATFTLSVFRSEAHKCYSNAGESEGAFRARLQQLGNEARDKATGALRARYEKKLDRLEKRLEKARQRVDKESEQARTHKFDTAISFGTAVLGALLGRKTISATSAGRVGTAIRKAGRAREQAADVSRAEQAVLSIQADVDELSAQFEDEVADLEDAYDAASEELSTTKISAKLTDIDVDIVALGWEPHIRNASGQLESLAAIDESIST